MSKMMGAILPGNSTVELKEFDIPKPGQPPPSAEAISAVFTENTRAKARRAISRG